MVVLRNAGESGAKARFACEIERRVRQPAQRAQRGDFALPCRQRADVVHGNRDRRRGQNQLFRDIAVRTKHRAQCLVPLGHAGERALERGHVERTLNPAREGRIVGREPRRRAVEQPEHFLRVREWHTRRWIARRNRRRRRGVEPLVGQQLLEQTLPLPFQLGPGARGLAIHPEIWSSCDRVASRARVAKLVE